MKKILFVVLLLSTHLSFAEGSLNKNIKNFKKKSKAPKSVRNEFKRATLELRDSGIVEKSVKTGVLVPNFSINGKKISEYYKKKPLVIKFYRGHWCPYCMLELKEYQKNLSIINKHGSIIALVPDVEKEIKKTKRNHKLTFPIYRDSNHKIGKLFGLAFKVDKKILELYKGFKVDLEKSQGNSEGELPMPGTYVVNTKGKIIYAFVDADYTKRAPLEDVISALKNAR